MSRHNKMMQANVAQMATYKVIRLEDKEMYDVIAVNMTTHKVRLIGENKTESNADATVMMAVARRGCDEEFFTKAPAGKYKEGDEWDTSDENG